MLYEILNTIFLFFTITFKSKTFIIFMIVIYSLVLYMVQLLDRERCIKYERDSLFITYHYQMKYDVFHV